MCSLSTIRPLFVPENIYLSIPLIYFLFGFDLIEVAFQEPLVLLLAQTIHWGAPLFGHYLFPLYNSLVIDLAGPLCS